MGELQVQPYDTADGPTTARTTPPAMTATPKKAVTSPHPAKAALRPASVYETQLPSNHAFSPVELPEIHNLRDNQDNLMVKLSDNVTGRTEYARWKNNMPARASGRNYQVEVLCEWCSEGFGNDHLRTTMACCGFLVGDSCLEDLYGEDDSCWNCSASRPAPSTSKYAISEEPVYIRRFVSALQTKFDPPDADDEDLQCPKRHIHASAEDAKITEACFEPLFQAPPEAKEAFQARTRLVNAMESFMQLWTRDAEKLRGKDRKSVIDWAQKALSGWSLLPFVRPDHGLTSHRCCSK